MKALKSHGDLQIADSSQGVIEGTLKALAAIEAKIDP